MASSAPIESFVPQPTRGSKPFSTLTLKKFRISPYTVTRFIAKFLLSLKLRTIPRDSPDLAVALRKSCVGWKKNVLNVEDIRSSLRKLPPSSTDLDNQLPHALVGYDEVSASDYVGFLQASRGFAHSYVDAVVERMCFQNGALEALLALLEMARRLRGEAVQLKVSFKAGPCRQFKCIVKEVNSKPLLLDVDVLKNIDLSLKDIQAGYQLLDDFWVTELEMLNKAIDTMHVDLTRVERWSGYKSALEESISNWKSIGLCADDGIKDAEMDADTQTPTASDLAVIAEQLHPHMATVGSLLYTMRDHVNRADVPPIQGAIFGLQESQQRCLRFFSECIKYWEKANMRCEISAVRPTLEKLVTSQRLLVENLSHVPEKAQLAVCSLRNAIGTGTAHDWSNDSRDRCALNRDSHNKSRLQFGPERIDDILRHLRFLDVTGYDPFEGMSLEDLEKERKKWKTCCKFFESELRSCQVPP